MTHTDTNLSALKFSTSEGKGTVEHMQKVRRCLGEGNAVIVEGFLFFGFMFFVLLFLFCFVLKGKLVEKFTLG